MKTKPAKDRNVLMAAFQDYNSHVKEGRTAFHDAGLESIDIRPPQRKGRTGQVKLVFRDDTLPIHHILIFKDCVNMRGSMDFDVLAHNAGAGQTSLVAVSNCDQCMIRLIRAGQADWNVNYDDDCSTPATYKEYGDRHFILVSVCLHGGTIDFITRDLEVKTRRIPIKQRK